MSAFLVYVRLWWAAQTLLEGTRQLARMLGNLTGEEPTAVDRFLEEAQAIDECGREVAVRMICFRDCLAEVQKLEPEEVAA